MKQKTYRTILINNVLIWFTGESKDIEFLSHVMNQNKVKIIRWSDLNEKVTALDRIRRHAKKHGYGIDSMTEEEAIVLFKTQADQNGWIRS